MNAELREIFRTTILRSASAVGEIGVTIDLLETMTRAHGIKAAQAEITEELAYLVDKALLARVPKLISPENRRWRVTAAGRDHLAEAGF